MIFLRRLLLVMVVASTACQGEKLEQPQSVKNPPEQPELLESASLNNVAADRNAEVAKYANIDLLPKGALARLGSAAFRTDYAGSVKLYDNGRLLHSQWDQLWDVESGRPIAFFDPELENTRWQPIAFSIDGKRALAERITWKLGEAAQKGPLSVWDITGVTAGRLTGSLRIELNGEPSIKGKAARMKEVAFSNDGRYVVVENRTKVGMGIFKGRESVVQLMLWDIETKQLLWKKRLSGGHQPLSRHSTSRSTMAFSRDSQSLISITRGYKNASGLNIWQTSSGKPLLNTDQADNWQTLNPIANGMVSVREGELYRQIKALLDPQDDQSGWTVRPANTLYGIPSGNSRYDVKIESNLTRISSVATLEIFDHSVNQIVSSFPVPYRTLPKAISYDGHRFVTARDDGTLEIFDRELSVATDGASAGWTKRKEGQLGHWTDITSLAWRPDGKVLATADCAGYIILWDIATRKEKHQFRPRKIKRESHCWSSNRHMVSWSKDGDILMHASRGASQYAINLYDRDGIKHIRELPGFDSHGAAHSISLTRDNSAVVFQFRFSKQSKVMSLNKPMPEIVDRPPYFSNADAFVITEQGEKFLRRYNGERISKNFSSGSPIYAVSTDGQIIVAYDGNSPLVHYLGRSEARLKIPFEPRIALFSPQGDKLAVTTARGKTLVVYSLDRATETKTLGQESHRFTLDGANKYETMNHLAFSPDGTQLVSGGKNGSLYLWPL